MAGYTLSVGSKRVPSPRFVRSACGTRDDPLALLTHTLTQVWLQRKLGNVFAAWSVMVAGKPAVFLLLATLLGGGGCFGLLRARFEDRVNKLWVEQGGRLDWELQYVEEYNGTKSKAAPQQQVCQRAKELQLVVASLFAQVLITVAPTGVLNELLLDEHLWLLKVAYNSEVQSCCCFSFYLLTTLACNFVGGSTATSRPSKLRGLRRFSGSAVQC